MHNLLCTECHCIFAGLTTAFEAAKINTPSHSVLDVLCIGFIQVYRSHAFVMGWSVVFAVIVSKIAAAWFPMDGVLLLVDSVL